MSEQTALKEQEEKAQPRQVRKQLSRPVMRQRLSLSSLQAQKVVDRNFSRVSNSLFSIDVILQIIGDREHVGQVEDIIATMIEKVSDELLLAQEQTKAAVSENGIVSMPEYTNPEIYDIDIISPQIAAYANLLVQLDTLMTLIDGLWLNGVFTNRQRADATFQWQQRLVRLSGRIIGIEKQARIAAYNKGKKDEVDREAPEVEIEDEELNEASSTAPEAEELSSASVAKKTKAKDAPAATATAPVAAEAAEA